MYMFNPQKHERDARAADVLLGRPVIEGQRERRVRRGPMNETSTLRRTPAATAASTRRLVLRDAVWSPMACARR